MRIKQLTVVNFRPYEKKTLRFSGSKTILIGCNGCGKTSLLEAIYLLLRGKSFRGTDRDILKFTSEWYRVEALFEDDGRTEERVLKFQANKDNTSKQFIINHQAHRRLLQVAKRPIVLFQPDDLNLINGSPSRRRLFIDNLISQIQPEYNSYLSRYDKALRQRNNLLKKQLETGFYNADHLFSWNVILSNYGAKIIQARLKQLAIINQKIEATYQQISGQAAMIKIVYQPKNTKPDQIQQQLFDQLSNHFLNTPVGPHRHDLEIFFNQQIASQHTSRGETRSLILALKIIEQQIICQATPYQPIILLDDVLSELDLQRRSALINNLMAEQIIISSTETINFPDLEVIDLSCN